MQPVPADRQLITQGVQRRASFSISKENAPWIKAILRDKIYTDKILAVIREYAANAWDANREAGRGDVPIEVTLPTELEPYLTIRDNGLGLSEDGVYLVFMEYGHSTKRTTNDAVGMLGIGSKAAFAYSDQFVITSWHEGTKAIYNAALTDDDDCMTKLGEWPSDEPSGIEIKVPVAQSDIYAFEQRARNLFPYFDPKPKINTDLLIRNEKRRVNGYIDERGANNGCHRPRGGTWKAVMGCIPYTVNIRQLQPLLEQEELWESLNRMNGGLYFDIGDVEIAASREELEYSDHTKTALVAKFRALLDEFVDEAISALQSAQMSPWDKRLKARFMANTLGLPLPSRWRTWGTRDVALLTPKDKAPHIFGTASEDEFPKSFTLKRRGHNGYQTNWVVPINPKTKIWLKDDTKHLSGYQITFEHPVLIPNKGVSPEAARAEFDAWALRLDITGVGVEMISSCHWTTNTSGRTPNKKHSVQTFVLKDMDHYHQGGNLSGNWDVVDREPEPTDVFVVLSHFKVNDTTRFYQDVKKCRGLCRALGVTMPDIYGYKTTARKPTTKDKCVGTYFYDWQGVYIRSSMNSTIKNALAAFYWSRILDTGPRGWGKDRSDTGTWLLGMVRERLGAQHQISQFVANHIQGRKDFSKFLQKRGTKVDVSDIEALAKATRTQRRPTAVVAYDNIKAKYPMMVVLDRHLLSLLDGNHGKLLLDYIDLVDGK
jgi:hypothetical protein